MFRRERFLKVHAVRMVLSQKSPFNKCCLLALRRKYGSRSWSVAEFFSRNGGFIFNTIHYVQARTPVRDIVAMLNARSTSSMA